MRISEVASLLSSALLLENMRLATSYLRICFLDHSLAIYRLGVFSLQRRPTTVPWKGLRAHGNILHHCSASTNVSGDQST